MKLENRQECQDYLFTVFRSPPRNEFLLERGPNEAHNLGGLKVLDNDLLKILKAKRALDGIVNFVGCISGR
jgi:hypothetical protein